MNEKTTGRVSLYESITWNLLSMLLLFFYAGTSLLYFVGFFVAYVEASFLKRDDFLSHLNNIHVRVSLFFRYGER